MMEQFNSEQILSATRTTIHFVREADMMVRLMAELCAGRLRRCRVDSAVLSRLKRELRDWSIMEEEWR